ncbi:hypothetical protein E0I74_29260 [Rhizobium laguerreae]|uniref:hypothetical protein n=1 Tax=Rhizobium laguerreae TaxID=1076926 RepID=UPI00103A096F|nr:hypothetical protein [Rhizobium laguerreae]MBY3256698.1 hypothetical protein [Rhizobium laguerreae]MBY3281882.1 hypothetical protein [Rhizobium laguerreae]MBY3291586.1 hypothetical protein [Rhizobium laguerreae]MBY3313354.1 hypothetical protein [Rhizobium laguerreae]MBY3322764.1 hypothetical protein [Rhizobium laguerreae]
MAATLKDIVFMLSTQKHKAKNKHAFSTPSKGFYDEAEASLVRKSNQKNIPLSIEVARKYRRPAQ